ncbi:rap guanine nucleotide exchange factor 6-like isoform X4 [Lineus longissimus]|uniref:rap guanine nucleotide exchange factor 6-like isoform X4 n=1 Tax=Lineus longissimus TaxID=88925 RepID=UPI00315DD5F5
MNYYGERDLISCLRKHAHERLPQELDIIFSFLHGLEALRSLREPSLRAICRHVRYEHHQANSILYCAGEMNTCWYILMAGSVFIDNSMYLPRSCFGKRTATSNRRPNECLVLEPSDMIVIDYPDVHLMKTSQQPPCANMNYDQMLPNNHNDTQMSHEVRSARGRHASEGCIDTLELPVPMLPRHDQFQRTDQYLKRNSRASDTSSAYSGSDMMQSSIDDQDMTVDLSGLAESLVDSDDEEGSYAESNDSYVVRDTVRECLEKDPADRNEDDIEILLDFMQHFPAFMNMTLATRREFCAVMVFAVVEKAGTIVMNDSEELDSWSVILNGQVEIVRPDGRIEELTMGDSFGITPTMEKLYHKGTMRTMIDDCQFVCIAQADYYRILHQGEENTIRHEEEGKVTLVTEKRLLDGGRKAQITIRATAERLMTHLVDEHSSVDPTYVEDFLLTYRTFLKSPVDVANKLLLWFNDPILKDRVTRVVLLWVNNHFNDFETEPVMSDFLEKFEKLLERERMSGQMRLLSIACAAKARPRTVTLTRSTKDEILHFSVLGGLERNCGIFISKVERGSKANEAGLKRGDQLIEVNGYNFEQVTHMRALEILRGTTHLSITVRSNLLGQRFLPLCAFRDSILQPENAPSRPLKKHQIQKLQSDPRQRLSVPDLDGVPPVISQQKEKKADKKDKGMNATHKTKIRKALMKMNILPKNGNSDNLGVSDETFLSRSRASSGSSHSSSTLGSHLSASNPDLTSYAYAFDDSKNDFPEHVLKVFKSDQMCKYFLVHKETTAREVVMLALREFGITDPSSNYSLCEVIVEGENFIKQKRLPDQLSNLPDRIALNGRYYLKNNMSTETLVPDDMAGELMKENVIGLLQLNSTQIAAQLTLDDFQIFQNVELTEYVDDLYELKSRFGIPNLKKFAELVNREMFWVVTEVCSEQNLIKRSKIIKHFIKTAKHCKECKNFNSMFSILSGLGHGSVCRLRQTWDKVPNKYIKMFEDLQDLMDPSRNMSKYRNLIHNEHLHPPMIPFFPVVKKDLTFIHLGNDSSVDGLVNFEKLRMIAKEIRAIGHMCSAKYVSGDMSSMFIRPGMNLNAFAMFTPSATVASVATMRRKSRRASTIPNPKKMYEEAQMVRRVKTYLSNLTVIFDEEKLKELSHQCEAPAPNLRKRDQSPTLSTVSSNSDNQRPKFGASSPEAVRKLMSLSGKSRPLNPKHAYLPPPSSPNIPRRQGQLGPQGSPRQVLPHPHPHPSIHLSPESSSVVSLSSMALRKSKTSGSVGSGESDSPTNSIGSYQHPFETDSGHNSVTSSNFDAHSTSSIGSGNSPPMPRRGAPPTVVHPYPIQPCPNRPPLPSYDIAVQNASARAYSHYITQQYTQMRPPVIRRPPVPPDYYSATQQHFHRRKHIADHGRAHSHEGVLGGYYHYESSDSEEQVTICCDEEGEREQVSAV